MSFSSLGLHKRILQAVDDAGYSVPTPVQLRTIPPILQGRDVIGLAQTGTGKTAAFTLPLLSQVCQQSHATAGRGTRVLVIAPTRELVMQINQSIRTYGKYTNLRTAMVMGGASEKHQIEKLQSNVDIVIATPGRLMALMDAGHAVFGKLTHLVLDEADRMLDMGFLPDIEKITASLPKRRQSLLFSATLPPQVERLARKALKNPLTVEIGDRQNPAQTVEQCLYPVPQHLKADLLVGLLEDHRMFSVIVFVAKKEDTGALAKTLQRAGIAAVAIHGDCTQNHRSRTLRDFKANKIRVLVATDIAARGLDIPDVTHVVNYDFPLQNDDYADGARLDRLERYIGLTLKKRRLEGFDYKVPAPEKAAFQATKDELWLE